VQAGSGQLMQIIRCRSECEAHILARNILMAEENDYRPIVIDLHGTVLVVRVVSEQ
jgi:hypothetical protein